MADTKISALTSGNPAQSGDEIPIARTGANYKITAGSIAALASVSPAGSDTYVQFNDAGSFGADAGLAYNKTTNTLSTERVNLGTAGAATGILTLSGSTSGTVTLQPAAAAGTYTLTLPTSDGNSGEVLTTDGSGVLSWAASAGGSPGGSSGQLQYNNAGAFGGTSGITTTGTELTIASGTKTASAPVLDITQTWNNAAVAFTGLKLNVTNTASAAASLLADLQVGGASILKVRKEGSLLWPSGGGSASFDFGVKQSGFFTFSNNDGSYNFAVGSSGPVSLTYGFNSYAGGTADLALTRDAANTLAQRNGTNAQTLRVYNTYTDASNYERGFLKWDTNIFKIGAEKGGTGTQRQVNIATGAASDFTFNTSGTLTAPQDIIATRNIAGQNLYLQILQANIYNNFGNGASINIEASTASGRSAALVVNNADGASNRGSFTLRGCTLQGGDGAAAASYITGAYAFATATVNLSGGAVNIAGGNGASSSSGAAHGGALNLDGGQAYGTGVHGNIVVGGTRGALVTSSKTYANLPAAVEGGRSFVSDWTGASTFGTQVTGGGGSTKVPVWSDGTNWYVG
jgi:hypothetical protein